ncbi:MAG: cytochrome P450 [Rhodospirillaceae bacterium]|jgi:cytochrome P450|nr:cytochrome P450 [Rhodospirillaceae bacterium]MBT4489833.1 cytochrome P450 [Rhodospirillaceae bacterium]MBT5192307.1 cytochrome P450 [Rhodospirillaceae bacterium]MBT5894568.1 cytochrome P450 [Rhodospirillaceae bacterium]MBT6430858.1 cytochrome P450 [Rhodospirillaceae bacterium]
MTAEFDLKTPDAINDPAPIFAAMLAKQPVHYSASLKSWVVADYDNVKLALTDPRFSVEKMAPFADHMADGADAHKIKELSRVLGGWMVFKDPPAHTRLRGVLQQPFKPREMEKLRRQVVRIAGQVADELSAQAGGPVDFIAAFANPLPARVIATLIGVDIAIVPQLTAWSNDIAKFVFSARDTPDKYSRAHAALSEIEAFYLQVIADHRSRPRDDMLSQMIAFDEGDKPLTDDEIVSMMILFLFAGHETTTNLIANGMVALLQNPKQLSRLREDPSLLPSAIEEFLRYQGPVQTVVRIAKEDINLGGETIRAGQRVFALLGASHRDQSVFDNAHDVDITRAQNPHVAFGFGIHMCIGAPLARIEGQEAFRVLLNRFEDFRLAADELSWRDDFVTRGLESLPLTFKLRSS